MINEQILEGSWNELKGKLREKWGQLSDKDVTRFHGTVDELIGMIQRKTGEGREAIETFLEEATDHAGTVVGHAAEAARQYAHRATECVRGSARQAADHLHEGMAEAEDLVRDRPGQAVALFFGAGVIVGLVFALLWHSK